MSARFRRLPSGVLLLVGLCIGIAFNVLADDDRRHSTAPVKIDDDVLSGIGLGSFTLEIPGRQVTGHQFWDGDNLIVRVVETKPTDAGRNSISCVRNNNRDTDELVIVLNGMLVLTDDRTGISQEFVAGDVLIVPKGFTGTWQDHGEYREIAVHAQEAIPEGLKVPRPAKCSEEDRQRGRPQSE